MKLSAALLLLSQLAVSQATSGRLKEPSSNNNVSNQRTRYAKASKTGKSGKEERDYFNRVSNFFICSQIGASCTEDDATSAEIVAASEDGMTLIYTDAEKGGVGSVDITDYANPKGTGFIPTSGEPTSVAIRGKYAVVVENTSQDYVNVSGQLHVFRLSPMTLMHTIQLDGQPDSVAWSKDGKYIVVAIENERDEDLGDGGLPQMPPGFVVVLDASDADPSKWTRTDVDVTGLPGVRFPEDPEPEYVSINKDNIAVVTLQENNAMVLIDLKTKTVVNSISAGEVTLTNVDVVEEGVIRQNVSITKYREPDGVAWADNKHFIIANEGDWVGGGRGFTIFHKDGTIVYEANDDLEHITAAVGHYPENRSENKGNEPENVAVGMLDGKPAAFIVSERSSVIFVYDISDVTEPKFIQVLPAGLSPEGVTFIASRNLVVAACEVDDRGIAARAVISIYKTKKSELPSYPTITSLWSQSDIAAPIAWGALSGLSFGSEEHKLYSIEDSFYSSSRIFKIDTKNHPAIIEKTITIMDMNGVLDAAYPGVFGNADKTVNLDQEGITLDSKGYLWVASEGSGTAASGTPNILVKVDSTGVIHKVVPLPDDIAAKQLKWGLEGVTFVDDGSESGALIACLQRPWSGMDHPLILAYSIGSESWDGYLQYPLDAVESPNGGWIGLSDISFYNGMAYIIERDNQGGPDARVKKVYKFNPFDSAYTWQGEVINKELVYDMMPKLEEVSQGLTPEKVEGLAVNDKGMFIMNDNDGVDDYNGATYLEFIPWL
ncbi:hypothetical protein HJC23_012737 [Cyclotella cryptica]|uniref:Phytase-like domain-containing protein n=1 Tax=Cyclotella cryptica TaxID=29204 RepID=A0ABD3P7I9_9STRA|eukprot:CCRYP_016785-RA/>CCRYP_016785-RA protein AED:0.07 eAED:0.07 QI:0/1/0.5/1/1/1/4/0/774